MARNKIKAEQDDGSYVVKRSRRAGVFAFVICVLIAILIWAYAEADEKQKAAVLSEAVEAAAETAKNVA